MWWTLVLACSSAGTTDSDPDSDVDTRGVAPEVVSLTTSDGVTLVADLWAADAGSDAVVLVHMTPSGPWNRTDWPASFVESLHAQGLTVIAYDRRGAGDSTGEAQDAYVGDGGRLDMEAVVGHLVTLGIDDLVVIGASNGTTSMVDYAVGAQAASLPVPVGLVYLSGGSYTENQNPVTTVPVDRMWFGFPANEADWPTGLSDAPPSSWTLYQWEGSAHGTNAFADVPALGGELLQVVTEAFGE